MNRLLLLAFPLLALLACKPSAQPTAPATSPPPPKALAAAPSPAPAAPATGAEANKVHNCSSEEAGAPRNDTVTTLKDEKTGATILAAGAKLAGAPGVSVAELSQMPESWAGKTVRLEGNVSTMCNHRRTWFAMQSEDRQGGVVRQGPQVDHRGARLLEGAPEGLGPADARGRRDPTTGQPGGGLGGAADQGHQVQGRQARLQQTRRVDAARGQRRAGVVVHGADGHHQARAGQACGRLAQGAGGQEQAVAQGPREADHGHQRVGDQAVVLHAVVQDHQAGAVLRRCPLAQPRHDHSRTPTATHPETP